MTKIIKSFFLFATAFSLSFYVLTKKITNQDPPRSVSAISDSDSSNQYYVHHDNLHITQLDNVEKQKTRLFLISNGIGYSHLNIINELHETDINLNLKCDSFFDRGQYDYTQNLNLNRFAIPTKTQWNFKLAAGQNETVLLGPQIKRCDLDYFTDKNSEKIYQIRIESDPSTLHQLSTESLNLCSPQDTAKKSSSEFFFSHTQTKYLSCSQDVETIETLETPEKGFIAKIEMLLGKKLSTEFIKNQNPYAQLDFSQAPQLNLIILASLVYRADFYGTVMARVLEYHLQKNVPVYLVTTAYMMLDKDKNLLYRLSEKYANFRLQEFKYQKKLVITHPLRNITDNFRDMHIKLLVTLSDHDRNNAVVAGGRNIHDGFLFRQKPDLSRYPELVQYGLDEDFVHWNDFEMKITSRPISQMIAQQLLKFIYRDIPTTQMLSFNPKQNNDSNSSKSADTASSNDTTNGSEKSQIRHLISIPYADGLALEKIYVELIDSAQKSIYLSSPYFRPTPKILEAIKKAASRKVDIIIQTRVSLQGDTQAWLYEEVNKESINKLYQTIKIYEWTEDSILHSKFILVDHKVGFIGSVNLSRRSFYEDIENGFLIKNTPFIHAMEKIFQNYLEHSERITQPEKRKILPTLLINIINNMF